MQPQGNAHSAWEHQNHSLLTQNLALDKPDKRSMSCVALGHRSKQGCPKLTDVLITFKAWRFAMLKGWTCTVDPVWGRDYHPWAHARIQLRPRPGRCHQTQWASSTVKTMGPCTLETKT